MDDQALLELELPGCRFPVERGKIREMVRALHLTEPVLVDKDAAMAAGFDDITVPLTFSAVSMHWGPDEASSLGLDLGRVVAAGAEWEYLGDIVAGDELTVTQRFSDIQHKDGRRGKMTLFTRQVHYTNQRDELVLRLSSTFVQFEEAQV